MFSLIVSFLFVGKMCFSQNYFQKICDEYLIQIALIGKQGGKKNSVNIAEVNPNVVGNVIYRSPTKSRQESPQKLRIPGSLKKFNSPEKYRVIQDDDDTFNDKNNKPVQQAANLSQIEDIENYKEINLKQDLELKIDNYQSPQNVKNSEVNPYNQGGLQEKKIDFANIVIKNNNQGGKKNLTPIKQKNNKEFSQLIQDKENDPVPPTQYSSTQNKNSKSHNFESKFNSVSNSSNISNNNNKNQNNRYLLKNNNNNTIEEQEKEMENIYYDNDSKIQKLQQSGQKQTQNRRKKASHLNQILNSGNKNDNNAFKQQKLYITQSKQIRNQGQKDSIIQNQLIIAQQEKENQNLKSGTDSQAQTFQVINCEDSQQQFLQNQQQQQSLQKQQSSSYKESHHSLSKQESHSKIYKTTHEQQKKNFDKKNMMVGYQSPTKSHNSDQLKDIQIIQQPSTNRLPVVTDSMFKSDSKNVLGDKTGNTLNTQEKLQTAIKNAQKQREQFDKKFENSFLQIHKCENQFISENDQNITPASRKNYLSKKDLSECHSFQEKLQKVNSQHYYGQQNFFNNQNQHLNNMSDCSIEKVDKEEEILDKIQIKQDNKNENNENKDDELDLDGEEEVGIEEFQFQNIQHSDFMKTQNYDPSDVKVVRESISKAEVKDFTKDSQLQQLQQQQQNGEVDLNNMECVNTIDNDQNNKNNNQQNGDNSEQKIVKNQLDNNPQIKGRTGRSVTVNNHHRKINGYMIDTKPNTSKTPYDKPITPKYQKGPNPYLDDSLQHMKREQEKLREQLINQKNQQSKGHSRNGSTDKSGLRLSQKMKSVLNAYGCVGEITDQTKQIDIKSKNSSQNGSRIHLHNNSGSHKPPTNVHSRNLSTKNKNSNNDIKYINKIPSNFQYTTSPVNSDIQVSKGLESYYNKNLN